MSEIYKIIISFIVFILWSFGMFGFGYILSNQRATEQLNKANRQLADEQQKYASLVRETEERISNIREELRAKLSNNDKATTELRAIIEQIKRQRIDL